MRGWGRGAGVVWLALACGGCGVMSAGLAVGGAVVTVGAGAVSLAVDAGVLAVEGAAAVGGAVVDAVRDEDEAGEAPERGH